MFLSHLDRCRPVVAKSFYHSLDLRRSPDDDFEDSEIFLVQFTDKLYPQGGWYDYAITNSLNRAVDRIVSTNAHMRQSWRAIVYGRDRSVLDLTSIINDRIKEMR